MVIVDTNIFIAFVCGNEMASQFLKKYFKEIAVSIVTEMELYVGATNPSKKKTVVQLLKQHEIIPLSKNIGDIALRLIKTYNTGPSSLFLPDALIAATCLDRKATLLTFNTGDFKMIKRLQLVH